MSIIREKEPPRIKEISYDDARQRIKMLDEEIQQHQAQLDTEMETIDRLKYMIDSCYRMRKIFLDDLEEAGQDPYEEEEVKTDDAERPVSDLYPVQP